MGNLDPRMNGEQHRKYKCGFKNTQVAIQSSDDAASHDTAEVRRLKHSAGVAASPDTSEVVALKNTAVRTSSRKNRGQAPTYLIQSPVRSGTVSKRKAGTKAAAFVLSPVMQTADSTLLQVDGLQIPWLSSAKAHGQIETNELLQVGLAEHILSLRPTSTTGAIFSSAKQEVQWAMETLGVGEKDTLEILQRFRSDVMQTKAEVEISIGRVREGLGLTDTDSTLCERVWLADFVRQHQASSSGARAVLLKKSDTIVKKRLITRLEKNEKSLREKGGSSKENDNKRQRVAKE